MLRPRTLVALVVAGAGLATAIWLPMRNDTAAASDRDHGSHQSRDDRRDDDRRNGNWRNDGQRDHDGDHDNGRGNNGRDRDGRDRDGRDRTDPSPTTEAPTPPQETVAPTEKPTAPPDEPTATPTTEPPATPPATDPIVAVHAWEPFINYIEGDVLSFDDVAYEVLQAHTSLPDWEPPAVNALFKPLL